LKQAHHHCPPTYRRVNGYHLVSQKPGKKTQVRHFKSWREMYPSGNGTRYDVRTFQLSKPEILVEWNAPGVAVYISVVFSFTLAGYPNFNYFGSCSCNISKSILVYM